MTIVEGYGLREPHLSQLKNIIKATRGSEIFGVLAGSFPTTVILQGAFLSLAMGVERKVGPIFEQVINSQLERDEVIKKATVAHRHLPVDKIPVIESNRPGNIASAILINAIVFENKGHAIARLLNIYDRSDHRKSTLKILPEITRLANSIAIISD